LLISSEQQSKLNTFPTLTCFDKQTVQIGSSLLVIQVTWMTRGHELVEALQAKIRNPSVMRLFSLSLQDFAEQCFVAAEAMPV